MYNVTISLLNAMAVKQSTYLLGALIAFLLLASGLSAYMYFTGINPFISAQQVSKSSLHIAFDSVPAAVNPYSSQAGQRAIAVNVFEGLTFTDTLMRPERQLALSYGNISPTEWEMKLKPDVRFHDGSILTAEDVVQSFERSKKEGDPELVLTLENISKVSSPEPMVLRIQTDIADPLLPLKVAAVPITKVNPNPEAPSPYIGTGPYMLTARTKDRLTFTRFEGYHGVKPQYKEVEVLGVADKFDRIDLLTKGQIDLLANVPTATEQMASLSDAGFLEVRPVPSLETMFLIMNVGTKGIPDRPMREAISKAINNREIASFAEGYATPTNQFISSGVTGFDADLPEKIYNPEESIKYVDKRKMSITVSVLRPMKILAEYIKVHLKGVGIDVEIDEVSSEEEFLSRIKNNSMQAYILGWKFDMGDSMTFFKSVIHSKKGQYGEYNAASYSNATVDALIEQAERELDETKRVSLLKQVQKNVLEGALGVPLFESKRLYAFKKGLQFEPRLDGVIYFPALTTK